MINTPMFFAAVPKTFLDKFPALAIDPAKIAVFPKAHPETASQGKFLKDHSPPPGYANAAFYGIRTFKFVNAADGLDIPNYGAGKTCTCI